MQFTGRFFHILRIDCFSSVTDVMLFTSFCSSRFVLCKTLLIGVKIRRLCRQRQCPDLVFFQFANKQLSCSWSNFAGTRHSRQLRETRSQAVARIADRTAPQQTI